MLFSALVALSMGAMSGLTGSATAAETQPTVVVELFTSQGCSSCPPADKLLGELVGNPNIIALTEAVDYWDYLGWKDENARHEHTERQQNYARMRGDRRIYTPQMVINGRVHVVGSRRGDVAAALGQLSKGSGALSIPIETRTDGQTLSISVDAMAEGARELKDGTLYLVPFKREVTADIKRGENRGRQVTYHNVVSEMRPIGMWYGKSVDIQLPLKELSKGGYDGCAILLQADVGGLPGPIFGATMVALN